MSLLGVWTVQAYLSCLIINWKKVDNIATNRFFFAHFTKEVDKHHPTRAQPFIRQYEHNEMKGTAYVEVESV